jgi:DNA/RNA-binding domain of Phe-tRNA-synthetase-like protein
LPFEVELELDGWELFWAHVRVGEDPSGLPMLRQRIAAGVRTRFADASAIAAHPVVAALRGLFRAVGCDPSRYRPSSEALLRRLVKGAELPVIHPLVDLNNCLSAETAAPCCVMRDGSFGPRLSLRAGRPGESYTSLCGPFNLESKPLLADERGPLDAPITGSERVKVQSDTTDAWLVAYLPRGVVGTDAVWMVLDDQARDAGVTARRFSAGMV